MSTAQKCSSLTDPISMDPLASASSITTLPSPTNSDPASGYVAELAAIQYTLGIIETLESDHYFIFTDSLSSIEAIRSMRIVGHSPYFLGKIRELLSALSDKSYQITLVWVPAHCSIPGNEEADSLAKVGAIDGEIYERPIAFHEFFAASRQRTLASWQTSWTRGELGRWYRRNRGSRDWMWGGTSFV